jgi:hypothetical protein
MLTSTSVSGEVCQTSPKEPNDFPAKKCDPKCELDLPKCESHPCQHSHPCQRLRHRFTAIHTFLAYGNANSQLCYFGNAIHSLAGAIRNFGRCNSQLWQVQFATLAGAIHTLTMQFTLWQVQFTLWQCNLLLYLHFGRCDSHFGTMQFTLWQVQFTTFLRPIYGSERFAKRI